jgi:hypothetical protein
MSKDRNSSPLGGAESIFRLSCWILLILLISLELWYMEPRLATAISSYALRLVGRLLQWKFGMWLTRASPKLESEHFS